MRAPLFPGLAWRAPLFAAMFALAVASSMFNGELAGAAGPVTRTWTGGGVNGNWMTNANWEPAAPNAGDILVFPEVAARKTNTNNFPDFTSFSDIRFEGDGYSISGNRVLITGEVWNTPADGTNSIALIIDGAADVRNSSGRLNLLGANSYAGTTTLEAGILHAGHNNAFGEFGAHVDVIGGTLSLGDGVSILNPLTLGSPDAPLLQALGEATWVGPVSLSDDPRIDIGPAGDLLIDGPISGPSGFAKTGTGVLILDEVNTFLGTVEIEAGTLRVAREEALGPSVQGTNVHAGATLETDGANLLSEPILLNGAGANGLGALRSREGIVIFGDVSIGSDTTIRVDAGTLRLENGLGNEALNDRVTKTGSGRLEFEGNGAFDGFLELQVGELSVRGTILADIEVKGGLVTGDGRVGRLGLSGGVLQPGVQGLGTLTVAGDAFIGEGSTARFTLNGPAAQTALRVEGDLGIGSAVLEITGNGLVPPGTEVTFIQHAGPDPIFGIFLNLSDSSLFEVAGHDFRLSYDGGPAPENDFTLTALDGIAPADLVLSAAPDLSVAPVGSVLRVVYRAWNLGPATAPEASFGVAVHNGFTFASFEASPGWVCVTPNAGQTGSVICERASFAPTPAHQAHEFILRVNVAGAVGAALMIAAQLNHDGVDNDGFNNFRFADVTVGPADPRPFKLRVPFAARDGVN